MTEQPRQLQNRVWPGRMGWRLERQNQGPTGPCRTLGKFHLYSSSREKALKNRDRELAFSKPRCISRLLWSPSNGHPQCWFTLEQEFPSLGRLTHHGA